MQTLERVIKDLMKKRYVDRGNDKTWGKVGGDR